MFEKMSKMKPLSVLQLTTHTVRQVNILVLTLDCWFQEQNLFIFG